MRALRRRLPLGGACSAATALRESCRGVRRDPGPDRGYNEKIQDAQNAFAWHDHHIFRPHQHFTYDPSNWSRTLAEKEKSRRRLSLVERVQMEEEHAREAASSREAGAALATASLAAMGDGSAYEDVWEAFGDSTAATVEGTHSASEANCGAWASVPLQELLDEAHRLQQLILCPRHRGNASLRLRQRQSHERDVVLTQLFLRVEHARVGESVTLNALIFVWFALLDSVTDVLRALAQPGLYRAEPEPSVSETEAVNILYAALERTLLPSLLATSGPAPAPLTEQAASTPNAGLAVAVETAFILLHPFTTRCAEETGGSAALGALEEAALRTCASLPSCLTERLIGAAAVSGVVGGESATGSQAAAGRAPSMPVLRRQELLGTAHTRALARVVAASSRQLLSGDGPLTTLALRLLRGNCACVEELLRTSTAPRGRHALRAALSPPRARAGEGERVHDAGTAAVGSVKALTLDPTGPPRGIVMPLTEPDDVGALVEAATLLLPCAGASVDDGMGGRGGDTAAAAAAASEALDAVLQVLAHTPNYDLDPSTVARFASTVVEAGMLRRSPTPRRVLRGPSGVEQAHERALRLLLLLTRVDLRLATQRGQLPRLLASLCRLPSPDSTHEGGQREQDDGPARRAGSPASREWRRLRGLVVRQLLDTVRAGELDGCPGPLEGGTAITWEELLAHGSYDGLVPRRLWRDLCERRRGCRGSVLAVAATASASRERMSSRSAFALLCLRSRLTTEARESRRVPLDLVCLELVACCVEALSGGRVRVEELLSTPAQWEEAADFLLTEGDDDERDAVLTLFAEAKALVESQRKTASKVVSL